MLLRLFSRYCLSDSSPSIIYPRDCVPVFFAFGSDRKRIRPHYLPTVSGSKDKSRLV